MLIAAPVFGSIKAMLTSRNQTLQLPQNDLVYLAFRLAIQRNLLDLRELTQFKEEPSLPTGFLTSVPFLAGVPLHVQTDLLAETWARHFRPDSFDASLLDAAVLYAACRTASRLSFLTDMAETLIRGGPRHLNPRILDEASKGLQTLFYGFWKIENFLSLEGVQDLPQDHLVKEHLGLTTSEVQPMYEVLGRAYVSPEVTVNLVGLLSEEEIVEALTLLRPPGPK